VRTNRERADPRTLVVRQADDELRPPGGTLDGPDNVLVSPDDACLCRTVNASGYVVGAGDNDGRLRPIRAQRASDSEFAPVTFDGLAKDVLHPGAGSRSP
jgi:hypothetical protein